MRAATLAAPGTVVVEDVADPVLVESTDALVQVVATCICGSDLWPYRGIHETTPGTRLGHEFVGTVLEVGPDVRALRPGQFVIAPFLLVGRDLSGVPRRGHDRLRQRGLLGPGGIRRGAGSVRARALR